MSYDAMCSSYENEIRSLRAALAKAEQRNQSIRDTCITIDKCNDRLEAALAEAERERDGKSTQIAELQEELCHLHGIEQRAERAEAERDKLRSSLENIRCRVINGVAFGMGNYIIAIIDAALNPEVER